MYGILLCVSVIRVDQVKESLNSLFESTFKISFENRESSFQDYYCVLIPYFDRVCSYFGDRHRVTEEKLEMVK